MKKISRSKLLSQEETPIYMRLGRRHTIEREPPVERETSLSRSASRTNSVGSSEDAKGDFSDSSLKSSDGKQSNFSNASTVVITENELSASWLYKERKARMNKNEENTSRLPPEAAEEDEDLKPVVLQDPNLKPIPIPLNSRPKKTSSCCCYMIAIIIICLCSLGIISAIGGIVYMEVFATYKKINSGLTTDVLDRSSNKLNANAFVEKNAFKENKNFPDHDPKKHFVKALDERNSEPIGINTGTRKGRFLLENEGGTENIQGRDTISYNPSNLEDDGNQNAEQPDKGSHVEIIADGIGKNVAFSTDDHDNSRVPLQSEDVLKSKFDGAETRFFLNPDQVNIDSPKEQSTKSKDLDSVVISLIKKQTFTVSPAATDNSSRDLYSKIRSIISPGFSESNQERDSIEGFKTEEHSNVDFYPDTKNDIDNEEVLLNRPVVDTNIALPIPEEFLRRLLAEQEIVRRQQLLNFEPDSKFSVDEALKHLRHLDVNNRLPTARMKSNNPTNKISKPFQENRAPEDTTERSQYLEMLRRKLYE